MESWQGVGRAPDDLNSSTPIVSRPLQTYQSSLSDRSPIVQLRQSSSGHCYRCNAKEASRFRTGPDGPATLCGSCHYHYAKFKLTVYRHPVTAAISILEFQGSVPMRVIDFECSKSRPVRDLQKPILVEQDHAAPSPSVGKLRSLQSRYSFSTAVDHVTIFSDYAKETELLVASVAAAEARLETRTGQAAGRPPTMSDPDVSTKCVPTPEPNPHAATTYHATHHAPRPDDSPQLTLVNNCISGTLSGKAPSRSAKSTSSSEEHQPRRSFARIAPRFKRKRERRSEMRSQCNLPATVEPAFMSPISAEQSQPSQLQSSLPALAHHSDQPLADEPSFKRVASRSGDIDKNVLHPPSSLPSHRVATGPVSNVGSMDVSQLSFLSNRKPSFPSPSQDHQQTPTCNVANRSNGECQGVHTGGEGRCAVSRCGEQSWVRPRRRLRSSPCMTSKDQTTETVVLHRESSPSAIEYIPTADETPRGHHCATGDKILESPLTPIGCTPAFDLIEATEKGDDTEGLGALSGKPKVLDHVERALPGQNMNDQASLSTGQKSTQARSVDSEGAPIGCRKDFSIATEKRVSENGSTDQNHESCLPQSKEDCVRAGCRRAACATGPDGEKTLCTWCGNKYARQRLVLFQECGSGQLSAVANQGWTPVMQVDEETGGTTLVPLQDVPKGGIIPPQFKEDTGSETESDDGADGSDWEAENCKQLEAEEDLDPMDVVAVDDSSSHSVGTDRDSYSTISSTGTDVEGQAASRMIDIIANYGTEFRSFQLRTNTPLCHLMDKVEEAFGVSRQLKILYQDNEGDFITVSSERDALEMFHFVELFQINSLEWQIKEAP